MIPQIDNQIISSFMLFLDHEIQRQGLAYSNKNGLFYPANSNTYGLNAYSCPYKQLCNDTSISGANVISGVYINGSYTPVGTNGLYAINHYEGSIYFSSPPAANAVISGNFAVKDFAVYLSDQPDYKIIFQSKYQSNPKYGETPSGIPLDVKVAPGIFLVPKNQENRAFAFAGLDDNYNRVRAIVVADSVYQRMAVSNILKNFRLKNLNLVLSTPFDYLGNITGQNSYNYTGLSFASNYFPLIMTAKVVEIPQQAEYLDINKQFSMVDFEISTWAGHM
jgi:hypothetical protein